jgi:glycosyltransferase involved in cell wall biosynthesis
MPTEVCTLNIPDSLARKLETANQEFLIELLERGLQALKIERALEGSSPNTEIQKLGHNNKSINITGFVEDIRPGYKTADICVIPLRIARGIQNKVLEAMSMGKAVVTTSTAVQSIRATPGVHLLVEDNFNKLAETVSMLLENHSLRINLGTNARQFVKSNYNWQTNMKKFEELMGQTIAGRPGR